MSAVQLVPRPQRSLILELTIDGQPLPKERARVVGKRAFTPARTLHNEMALEWLMKAKCPSPVYGNLIVDVDFFRNTKVRCDIDNLIKSIFDAANGVVWNDDSQVIALYAQKLYDKTQPRTELRVWRTVEPE